MSIENPIDPQAPESARGDVRRSVAEISQLLRTEKELQPFLDKFLGKLIGTLAAAGGAVWLIDEKATQIRINSPNFLPDNLPQDPESQQSHAQLLGAVIASSEPTVIRSGPIRSGPAPSAAEQNEPGEAANPTSYVLLLAPLKTPRQRYGVVEIFLSPGDSVQIHRGYLRFIVQMCELAAEFLKAREVQQLVERESTWARLDRFTATAHQSLDLTETTYTLANEACELIGCDRVSIAVRRRKNAVIQAVSGQDVLEKRANSVRMLQALVQQVVQSGEPLWYTGDTADLPPQLEAPLHDYIDESNTRTLGIIPLVRELRPDTDEETAETKSEILATEVIGALIVEQFNEADLQETLRQKTDLVARRATSALANAVDHDRVFLMPVWRTLGKMRWFTQARRLPKLAIGAGVAVLVVVLLCTYPTDFRVTASGTLQPAVRREVFVQESGVVSSVIIDQGSRVQAGEELLTLRNRELEVQITELHGRQAATLEQVASARRSAADPKLSTDERNRQSGQFAQLQKTYKSLSDQLKLLQTREEMLVVRSPIDGVVLTWDVKKRLTDRPVEKGQVLLTVADIAHDWELELNVPEAHSGYVTAMWEAESPAKRTLPVHYILATDPALPLTGNVVEVQQSAEVRGEDGNTVMVRVKIDAQKISAANLKPGAAVTGQIYCGRRSIGYVWFHDVVAFIRSKILFRN